MLKTSASKEFILSCVQTASMIMNNLVFLRFSKGTLKTLNCALVISENIATGTKFRY